MDPSHSESDDLRFKLSVEATTLLIVPSLVRCDIDSLAFSACTPSPWCMNPGARRSDSLRRTPLFSLFFATEAPRRFEPDARVFFSQVCGGSSPVPSRLHNDDDAGKL